MPQKEYSTYVLDISWPIGTGQSQRGEEGVGGREGESQRGEEGVGGREGESQRGEEGVGGREGESQRGEEGVGGREGQSQRGEEGVGGREGESQRGEEGVGGTCTYTCIYQETRGQVVYRAYIPYLGIIYVTEANAIMCCGDGVRGLVQLSAVFLPLSLFRDSANTANYGWTLYASCWPTRANLGRLIGR